MLPDFRKIFLGWGGVEGSSKALPSVLLERGLKMSMGHWWNGIDRIKPIH